MFFVPLEGSDPVEAQGLLLGSGPEVQRIISASHCVCSWTSEVATKLCGSLYCEDYAKQVLKHCESVYNLGSLFAKLNIDALI